jgi:hypothetical protein
MTASYSAVLNAGIIPIIQPLQLSSLLKTLPAAILFAKSAVAILPEGIAC